MDADGCKIAYPFYISPPLPLPPLLLPPSVSPSPLLLPLTPHQLSCCGLPSFVEVVTRYHGRTVRTPHTWHKDGMLGALEDTKWVHITTVYTTTARARASVYTNTLEPLAKEKSKPSVWCYIWSKILEAFFCIKAELPLHIIPRQVQLLTGFCCWQSSVVDRFSCWQGSVVDQQTVPLTTQAHSTGKEFSDERTRIC